jgi:azurin
MKTRLLVATALIALLVSACGKKDSSAPASSSSTASTTTAPAGPRTVEITANDQMKYSLSTIEAKAGEQLTVVLTNVGTQPKEAMGHNWILLKPGVDAEAFDKAASAAKDTDYFPNAMADQVIAHIPLLGPRKSGEITFTVPAAGEYTFLCSFPAHFQVGMKGKLVVK